jgi:hypothetical protein
MRMKVDHSQFEIDGERLTHAPTGTVFWKGEKDVVLCEWGETKLASGHDYDREELVDAARAIFVKDKTTCT